MIDLGVRFFLFIYDLVHSDRYPLGVSTSKDAAIEWAYVDVASRIISFLAFF